MKEEAALNTYFAQMKCSTPTKMPPIVLYDPTDGSFPQDRIMSSVNSVAQVLAPRVIFLLFSIIVL